MASFVLFSLILVSLSSLSLSSPTTFFNAAEEVLADSGYLSMALTLQLTFKTLNLHSQSVTIFAPCDRAFSKSGQPSLFDLQYHISPVRLSKESLKTLPFGTKIPTLLPNSSLIVTTSSNSNGQLSINNVLIHESAVFFGGSMVIYGINEFFDTSFQISRNPAPEPSPTLTTAHNDSSKPIFSRFDVDFFNEASDLLMSRGYTTMATFLQIQLVGFSDETRLTTFAPVDEAMKGHVRNVSDYSLIFRRHVVPRLVPWQDLVWLKDGTKLPTFSQGFEISVSKSGDVIVLNGVPVTYPDMYSSKGLVVHGVNGLLMSATKQQIVGESFSELNGQDYQNPLDYAEYEGP